MSAGNDREDDGDHIPQDGPLITETWGVITFSCSTPSNIRRGSLTAARCERAILAVSNRNHRGVVT